MGWFGKSKEQIAAEFQASVDVLTAAMLKDLDAGIDQGFTLGDQRAQMVRAMLIMRHGDPDSPRLVAGNNIIAHLDTLLLTASDEDKVVGGALRTKQEAAIAARLAKGESYNDQLVAFRSELSLIEKHTVDSAVDAMKKDNAILSIDAGIDLLLALTGQPSLYETRYAEVKYEIVRGHEDNKVSWAELHEMAEGMRKHDVALDPDCLGARVGTELCAWIKEQV